MKCYFIKYYRDQSVGNEGFRFSENKFDTKVLDKIKNFVQKSFESEKREAYSNFLLFDEKVIVFTYSTTEQSNRTDIVVNIGIITLDGQYYLKLLEDFLSIKITVFKFLKGNLPLNQTIEIDTSPQKNDEYISKIDLSDRFTLEVAKAVLKCAITPNYKLMINYSHSSVASDDILLFNNLIYFFIPKILAFPLGVLGNCDSPPDLSYLKFFFHLEDRFQNKPLEIRQLLEKDVFMVDFITREVNVPRGGEHYIDRIIEKLEHTAQNVIAFVNDLNEVIERYGLKSQYDLTKEFFDAVMLMKSGRDLMPNYYPTEEEKSKIIRYIENQMKR
ncbi:MAG: hypothetical protein WCQ41_01180 [Bacillota bacterium]